MEMSMPNMPEKISKTVSSARLIFSEDRNSSTRKGFAASKVSDMKDLFL
jgi:hypothetical protein